MCACVRRQRLRRLRRRDCVEELFNYKPDATVFNKFNIPRASASASWPLCGGSQEGGFRWLALVNGGEGLACKSVCYPRVGTNAGTPRDLWYNFFFISCVPCCQLCSSSSSSIIRPTGLAVFFLLFACCAVHTCLRLLFFCVVLSTRVHWNIKYTHLGT